MCPKNGGQYKGKCKESERNCAIIVRVLCGASEYFLKILWKLNKKEIDCQLTVYFLLDLSSLSCLQAELTTNVL